MVVLEKGVIPLWKEKEMPVQADSITSAVMMQDDDALDGVDNEEQLDSLVINAMIPLLLEADPPWNQSSSPFRGLEVLTGIGCGHCAYATSSSKCMQVHHREHHRDTITPKDWTACKMQRFSRSGKGYALFQVHDTAASPVPVDDTISHLRQQMAQALMSNMPQGGMSMLLAMTYAVLCDLVEIPRCDDNGLFPGLKAAVRQYFNEVLNLLTITDELVLQ
ncbi:hypothetical protein F5J12DRAFT_780307 [Pisolithus orientalis]|uniref:uncharacterized protein n=1 Tax=Pisolithus orientalis TaxID=936130 RepID=UPI0022259559|nr:uncharacterized protein F5J12DRAFT_780307 [Pisolithus orientalis]KAI6028758.1 hypothetical protein F5J12DRAFT_780307 [Pisolithus orientalis]